MITFGSLFAGIGGFDLGLERAGMVCKWQVEKDEFCQKVLTKHWSNVPKFGDIKNVTKKELEPVDLICGGFPCQPFSQAGKQRGKTDDRYLWPEMLRVIRELSPRWIIGENVAGFINMELENAFIDLEAEGYKVEAFVLPACAVGAIHRRNRIWIMAYSKCNSFQGRKTSRPQGEKEARNEQLARLLQPCIRPSLSVARTYRSDNGIPNRVDRNRSLGNAVVPQIPEILGRVIMDIENEI